MSQYRKKGERPIDRALKRALARGMNQSEFAAAMGVPPANVTNWKARGMPPEHHARAAKILHWTVDELLGRSEAWDPTATWPFDIPFQEFAQLKPAQKAEIAEIVEDRLRRFQSRNGPPNNTDA